RAEEAMRESEEKYRAVFETATDIIYVISVDGKMEAISPSVEAITGYRVEEWINRDMSELASFMVSADDMAAMEGSFAKAMQGKPDKVEVRIKRRDGTQAVTENQGWPLMKDGAVVKVIGIARDVTLRRKQEAELKILGDAIRQSGESVVITDGNGAIEYVNPAVERVTGYTPEEMIGGNPNLLRSDRHPPEFYREMWSVIKSGSVWKGMMINKRKNGELYHEEMTISPIMDRSGAAVHFVAIKRDVTARIHAQEEIMRAMELAQEANRLKDKFLSIAAHDLRTPFNSILGFLNILKEDTVNPLTPAQADLTGRAIRGADSLLKMIDEILELGSLQPGKLEMNKDVFRADGLAKSVIDELAHVAASKKVVVKNAVTGGVTLRTDQRLMRIVLRNLISNAIKFTPAGGSVEVFSPEWNSSAIGVRDTGVGVEPDKLPWIFSHDRKTSTVGTDGEKGSGLGLPFCNDIVILLGGRITVESAPGKGSVFTVNLPPAKPNN
ncbi:MAG: PAS domain S-box protein, partial [Nitrospinae bacterium]|nr:PAS domain S-box protein [Nitrospinota bacterium]